MILGRSDVIFTVRVRGNQRSVWFYLSRSAGKQCCNRRQISESLQISSLKASNYYRVAYNLSVAMSCLVLEQNCVTLRRSKNKNMTNVSKTKNYLLCFLFLM